MTDGAETLRDSSNGRELVNPLSSVVFEAAQHFSAKMVDRIQRFVNSCVANAGEQIEECEMKGNRSCPLPSNSSCSEGKENQQREDGWNAGISSS